MRALVWRGAEQLSLEDVPEPQPDEHEVLFDVALAGICGSDLHAYRGHGGPRIPPLVLGHEAVGTVPGRSGRFIAFPLVTCGACARCVEGRANLCELRGLLGMDRQGVFAERVPVREDLLVAVPDDLDDRLAALTEPLGTVVGSLQGLESPRSALIVGGGAVGLLAAYLCALRDIDVTLVEPVDHRRAVAEALGAGRVFADVQDVPAGAADVAIDAVGAEHTWRGAIAGVRAGGTVVLLGLAQADGSMSVGDVVRRGITLRGHFAYTVDDFSEALALLASAPPPSTWLTVMPLEDGAEAFRRLVDDPGSMTKVLLAPSGESS